MFIGISKAHLYAPAAEDEHHVVDLPPPECAKEGVCWYFNFWFYGMRLASKGWEEEYRRVFESIGFKAGVFSPRCFYCASDWDFCVVHGDDFSHSRVMLRIW